MELFVGILACLFVVIIWLGVLFLLTIWPTIICYKQASNKNLFGHYNWISVFIGLFFGWIGAIVLIILHD